MEWREVSKNKTNKKNMFLGKNVQIYWEGFTGVEFVKFHLGKTLLDENCLDKTDLFLAFIGPKRSKNGKFEI